MRPHDHQQEAVLIAATNGVDPRNIRLGGWNEHGYYHMDSDPATGSMRWTVDTDGEARIAGTWAEWPEGFPVERFLNHANIWLAYMNRDEYESD